jgi:alkylation response protein AidB-like acyl-CoA dehydrogenase
VTVERTRSGRGRRSRGGVAVDLQLPLSRAQEALREQVRRYLDRTPPAELARRAVESGVVFEAELWREMAEMEWVGILVPEELGGAEGSLGDVCVVAEELGWSLVPSPFLATAVLGATVLRHSGADELLEAMAAGRTRVAVALEGRGRLAGSGAPGVSASGSFAGVLDADAADVLVLPVSDADDIALVLVEAAAKGVTVQADASLDGTRHTCSVELDGTDCRVLAKGGRAEGALAEARVAGAIALAAELVGGARRCLALTVDYAIDRKQFGRAIGSFQAVKHRCVDVLVELEAARAAVNQACRLADEGDPDAAVMARVAKTMGSRALVLAASAAIQIHGGSGFLWDNDAHLYLKRGKASERMLGRASEHRLHVANALRL